MYSTRSKPAGVAARSLARYSSRYSTLGQPSLKSRQYFQSVTPRAGSTRPMMRSMRTVRSKSAGRLPPFSLILKRIRPSRAIHCSKRVGQPVAQRLLHVGRLQRIAGADGVEHRQGGAGGALQVAVEVFAPEVGAQVARQIARRRTRRRRSGRRCARTPCRSRRGWRRRRRWPPPASPAWGSARAASARRDSCWLAPGERRFQRHAQIQRVAAVVAGRG